MRLLPALMLMVLLLSGIGRDDVPLENYCRFAAEPQFGCAGELYCKGRFVSSCVLIGSRYVITTAHSVFDESKELVGDSIETPLGRLAVRRPKHTWVTAAANIRFKFKGYKAECSRIFVHPLYTDAFGIATDYDLAILELKTPIAGIVIPKLHTGGLMNKRGVCAGWGNVGTADDYQEKKRHKRRIMAGENMIDSVTDLYLWADMDHPRLAGFNRMGDNKPLPLEWLGNGGDCGGPLFIDGRLVGISCSPGYYSDMYNYGELRGVYYGFIDCWTKLEPVREWIDSCMHHK